MWIKTVGFKDYKNGNNCVYFFLWIAMPINIFKHYMVSIQFFFKLRDDLVDKSKTFNLFIKPSNCWNFTHNYHKLISWESKRFNFFFLFIAPKIFLNNVQASNCFIKWQSAAKAQSSHRPLPKIRQVRFSSCSFAAVCRLAIILITGFNEKAWIIIPRVCVSAYFGLNAAI